MSILKKPYEISIWEDAVVYVGTDQQEYNSISDIPNGVQVDYQYYSERKLAIIGSSTMTSPARTTNNVLKRNINGVETLTFDMYYQYEDIDEGQLVHNPLIDLVIDERKVKLHYDNKWYDFIVKKDDEKGREYKYSYTCTGLAANELGKTGFNIELDTELENNTGTVQELGAAVLENSDWQLAQDGQQVIQQTNDEALYLIKLNTNLTGTIRSSDQTKSINSGSYIYVYYTSYINQVKDYFQFIYVDKSNGLGIPDLYEDKITINCTNIADGTYDLYIDNVTWTDGVPSFEDTNTPRTIGNYRGRRYVRKQLMDYDPVLEQTIWKYLREVDDLTSAKFNSNKTLYFFYNIDTNKYERCTNDSVYDSNITYYKEYHGYTTTEYLDVDSVTNYIYNSTNFRGTTYWTAFNNALMDDRVYPDVSNNVPIDPDSELYNAYLMVKFEQNTSPTASRLVNDGIVQNYSRINQFEKGEKYRFKVWVGTISNDEVVAGPIPFKCIVKKYVKIDEDINSETNQDIVYFTFDNIGNEEYIQCKETDEFDSQIVYYIKNEDTYTVATELDKTTFDENKTNYYYKSGYRYIDAECTQSATWRELSSNMGIFLYPRTNDNLNIDYYIKDIQLYRYIEDENGNVMNIGDVPQVRILTNYHFYDPVINAGFVSAEDYIYSDNNEDYYIPLYGSGENEFEKVRSITAKESNRFNLLQELSEIFECWVRFEIAHDSSGKISIENYPYYKPVEVNAETWNNSYYIYNQISKEYQQSTEYDEKKKYFLPVTRKRQSKKVIFYGEILQDNFIGFKYGINLRDNNRTLDSEQIVTKIIVKDNTCDQAENGFCSIARAQDNPIKETFALNLDYYTSQGLINTSNLNNDLYLEVNGSIGLYPKLSRLNNGYKDSNGVEHLGRNQLIDQSALLANSITNLTAEYQAAQLRYNEGQKQLSKLLDPVNGTIVQYTGYQYEDFTNQYLRDDHTNIPAYGNEVYYISSAITNITPAPLRFCIRKPSEETTPQGGVTYYTLDNNHFKECIGLTKFFANTDYFKGVSAQYIAGTYFETTENTTTLSFTGNNSSEVYIYAAARRIKNLATGDYLNDNYTIQKITEVVTLTKNVDEAEDEMEKKQQALDDEQAEYDSIKAQLTDIAKSTEEIEKEFNTKYSRYIQEGSWTDDNYMDDDLYYFDALDVLYQSAYPKVTYNFKVLELSQLEGYEAYKFDIGHKTFVEDTEFFGYYWAADGLKTPVRETVVVTEANINLDEPDKNDLKVQNYKSHFEDLFQRITAATQSLEYHSGEYGRAAGAVTSEGTISNTVLQKSFNTASYIIQNSHDQSVVWDDTGIQATNLTDPAQVTRLASGGVLVSSDGGQTWGVAISGYGINASQLTAGIINADIVNIMSGMHSTFRWDALGLRAYRFETGENNVIYSYDPTSYVAHDRFGIYGLSGSLNPPPLNSVTDVENNANFALTWNGLFIRSTHRDGYVRVSPTDDIALYSTISGTPKLRGKFGLLEQTANDEIYGLALYRPELDQDDNPIPTVLTQSDGTLWLLDSMKIGKSNQTNTIYIGVGEEDQANNRYKVINVNDTSDNEKFVVYSDGTLNASGVTISGTINAIGGTIGNMSIAELGDTVGVRISPNGTEFKYDGTNSTPRNIAFTITHSFMGTVDYKWYKGISPDDLNLISGATRSTYTYNFDVSDFNNGVMYLKGEIISDENPYSDIVTISYVSDGQQGPPGEAVDSYLITTNIEELLKFINTAADAGNKKYIFSTTEFEMQTIDGLSQQPIPNSRGTYPYAELDININGYNLIDIIKEDYYNYYIHKIQDDLYSYRFNLELLYNNLVNNILINHIKDYIEDDVDEDNFNANKTNYYIYNGSQYVQCTNESIYNPDITYYILANKDEIIDSFINFFSEINTSSITIVGTLYKQDSQSSIQKVILMRNGLSEEMLKFSVNAGSLNVAIQRAGLLFNGEGLTVTNSGFKIQTTGFTYLLVNNLDENTFNNNKTNYYTYDEINNKYIPCKGEDEWNGETNYYIYTDDEIPTTVFSIDPTTHQLVMVGNGTFTGSITAANGIIGGFTIGENTLSTTGLILESAHDNVASSIDVDNIRLGTGANIKEYLNIGNLSLLNPSRSGEHDNSVLTLSNNNTEYFKLTDNGYIIGPNWSIQPEDDTVTARFGNLIAEGGSFSGTIYASDGRFSGEITASVINAATISTMNFVTENVRSMGGSFIFRPTFEIIEIIDVNNYQLDFKLRNTKYFEFEILPDLEQYIVSVSGVDTRIGEIVPNQSGGKYTPIRNDDIVRIQFNETDYTSIKTLSLEGYQTLTLFGRTDRGYVEVTNLDQTTFNNNKTNYYIYDSINDIYIQCTENDTFDSSIDYYYLVNGSLLIGINSDKQTKNEILAPYSLSMEKFTKNENSVGQINYNTTLLLGDLSSLQNQNTDFYKLSGYGLYADNVFLNGSLITKNINGNNFAGVNTQRAYSFNYQKWSNNDNTENKYVNDKIIFWGGASSTSQESIQEAPFIVTDQGNIFAKSGEFQGSVISNSVISQSIIETPIIYGTNKDSNTPSLKIYDTNTEQGGIGFYKLVDNIDEETNPPNQETNDVLTLNINNSSFIHYYNDNNTIKSISFITFDEGNSNIYFNGTSLTTGTTTYSSKQIRDNNAEISLNNKIKLSYKNFGVEISEKGIDNYGGLVINRNTTQMVGDTYYLEYKQIPVGNSQYYCLYVKET